MLTTQIWIMKKVTPLSAIYYKNKLRGNIRLKINQVSNSKLNIIGVSMDTRTHEIGTVKKTGRTKHAANRTWQGEERQKMEKNKINVILNLLSTCS